MTKVVRLIVCCLLILSQNGPRSAAAGLGLDQPVESFVTVQSRIDALAVLIAEREQLLGSEDQVSRVKVSSRIAELNLKLNELQIALDNATESLELARQVSGSGNAALLVETLILLGRVHIHRSENETALRYLNEALQLSRDLNYRDGEANSLARIGVAFFELGKHAEAEQNNNQALQIWQQHPNKRGEAQARTTQGEISMVRDQLENSTAALKTAETLWRSLGDSAELANTLVDQNFLAIRQGQWQTALVLLNEAEGLLVDKQAEPFLAGKIAMSFGEVYEAYGQLDVAFSYFREAQVYYRDHARDKRAAIQAGNRVARVQARLGDYEGAKQQIEQGLAEAVTIANDLNIGLCHENLGTVWLESGSYGEARLEFVTAIDHYTKSKSQREMARAQSYLGQTEYLLGNLARAEIAYENALRFFQHTPDYTNEAALRFGLGKLALRQGRLNKAEEHLQRSIRLTEQLRANASSRDLRSSFLASVHDRYQTYVEWLMTRYAKDPRPQFAIQAFEASESGRARALLDALYAHQKELRKPSDPLLLLDEEKLQKEEQRLVDKRAELVSLGGNEEDRTEVDRKLKEVRARYEALEARINSSSKFNNLLKPLSYADIQSLTTDAETSLLSYSLGQGKSFAWLVTQDGLETFELSDKRTIEKAANQLIALLKAPLTNPAEEAKLQAAINEVSRLVIGPVSTNLRTSRLIVVADGVLQYIPFQMLKTSNGASEPLISRFDIVNAPSASALAAVKRERQNRQPNAKLLIGFGDAVFSSRYTPHGSKHENADSTGRSKAVSRFSNLPRLFNAKRELRTIGELTGNDAVFYSEYDATRDNLLKADLSQYRILHIVTHGVLDTDQPELSGVVLSLIDADQRPVNGFVSLSDIYKMRAPVDLVVLSACQTALGQEVRGEGLIGLTRGFMYAGASGIVASLWQVDDRATAELMKYFYTNMLQRGMKPAAALRAAQNQIRSQPEWNSPHYWAGFTFHGDFSISVAQPVAHRAYGKYIGVGAFGLVLAIMAAWYVKRRAMRQTNQH